ncbi:MAG: UrcA family protein [Steroidobacteraceae bacterium]|jgi:UrcA family protein
MSKIRLFNTNKTRTTAVLGALAALLVGIAMIPTANAAASDEAPSLVVRFDAQSLASEGGAREVFAKIVAAARQVCPGDSTRELGAVFAANQCRKEAIARAVKQIHHPRLVEIAARHGKIV